MSLIECPECRKEVSDTVDNCIHCGFTITKKVVQKQVKTEVEAPKGEGAETTMNQIVDFIFGALYLFLIYNLFTDDSISMDGAGVFGMLIAFGILYLFQKIIKGVLATIARSFGDAFK